jgi:hypothetical protein
MSAHLIIGVVGISLMVVGAGGLLVSIYHSIVMLGEVKPSKKTIIHFLGPLALVMPSLWSDRGNRARIRSNYFLLLALACGGALFFLKHIVGL